MGPELVTEFSVATQPGVEQLAENTQVRSYLSPTLLATGPETFVVVTFTCHVPRIWAAVGLGGGVGLGVGVATTPAAVLPHAIETTSASTKTSWLPIRVSRMVEASA